MALDISLLYGEMVASALVHAAIVFAVYMMVTRFPLPEAYRLIGFIGICGGLSWVVQNLFLLMLQSSSCGGIKAYGGVAWGATVASLITAGMLAIPTYFEPMRLVVSHLFITHPEVQQGGVVVASTTNEANGPTEETEESEVNGPTEEGDAIRFREIALGAGFWGAFAGAYGIGIGSLYGTSCT